MSEYTKGFCQFCEAHLITAQEFAERKCGECLKLSENVKALTDHTEFIEFVKGNRDFTLTLKRETHPEHGEVSVLEKRWGGYLERAVCKVIKPEDVVWTEGEGATFAEMTCQILELEYRADLHPDLLGTFKPVNVTATNRTPEQ